MPVATSDKAERAERLIADAFGAAAGAPVYLAFSGGKESLAILEMCKPFRGAFKLLWVNTGQNFPHMERLIREAGDEFGLVELPADLVSCWKDFGLPTDMVSVGNMLPHHDELRLQPWVHCCGVVKSPPMVRFLSEHVGPAVVLHGQRAHDGAPGMGISGLPRPASVSVVAPLEDWTTQDVLAFVAERGVELPSHYQIIPDSLDCWVCPANWMLPHGEAYGRWMKENHPDLAQIVLPGVRRIGAAMAGKLNRLALTLEGLEP